MPQKLNSTISARKWESHTVAQAQLATRNKVKNSTLWGRVHSLITINKLAKLNVEFRVPGAPGARIGPFEARDKVYAQDRFLEHFRWCEQAQLLWRSSDEGKSCPTKLPETARRGSFFNKRE
ncbi:hypothetical protein NUU61_006722 [Penicillium alfredii]|uniref:Uncharacterized protein n=1 Tax=Penicillium alfredii TaxID=1506179 RepID=A0A9W9F1I3_9EURO|nr:uncharacterized protein NUU61_006722 [Penicillium alfredii]KAJ5091852.1 hypothetical protein NUU61_006722 [Penicillium alfredii]